MGVDGILIVDKAAGMTSHDVVGHIRRIFRTKRVGHAGTLDPDAIGVLVVAVGQATRLLPYLPLEPKVYVARAVFGYATDTEDASGRETVRADASSLTQGALESTLVTFVGEIQQIPPMVSALHHEGKRLYELARQGITVDRAPRRVRIDSVIMEDFLHGERAEATLRVICGSGTYIRTLCADIGASLGLPAHMKALRREAVGKFQLGAACAVADLESLGDPIQRLVPLLNALDLPRIAISDFESNEIGFGRCISRHSAHFDEATMVALIRGDKLRALATFEDAAIRPFRVFDL